MQLSCLSYIEHNNRIIPRIFKLNDSYLIVEQIIHTSDSFFFDLHQGLYKLRDEQGNEHFAVINDFFTLFGDLEFRLVGSLEKTAFEAALNAAKTELGRTSQD